MLMIRRYILPWMATALLLTLCLMPRAWIPRREVSPRIIPHLDKVVHFVMFAGFAVCWACAGRSAVPTRSRAAGVLATALVLAVGTELAQGLPQVLRDPDTLDALADVCGAVAGVMTAAAWGLVRDDGEPPG